MWYFSNFPKVNYTSFGQNTIQAMDITKRFKFIENVLTNKYILFNYIIEEKDRPDTIADKYYDDSKLDWIILLTNKVIDPYFDWPMSTREFDEFIKKKYGSIEWAKSNYAKYYKIFQHKTTTYDGFQVPKTRFEIDITAYSLLNSGDRERVSYYQDEYEKNEKRKIIKVIEKSFIPQILKEAEKIYGVI